MLALATNQLPKLQVIANLFDALHENAIVYCNLKGNEQHIKGFLTGDSDIDVLFDEKQKTKLEQVLANLGFKQFTAIKQKQYKDIVDFIALDEESGKVIHLHTYFRLTIGEPFLKGYQLDIENHILNSRVFNEEFGMFCIQPVFELTLLYLTESLKLRHRDIILMHLKNKTSFTEKVMYEYRWLTKRTSVAEMEAILKPIFKDQRAIYALMRSEFNRRQLYRLAPAVKTAFAKYKLYPSFVALLLRWYREATVSIQRKLSGILALPILSMRTNPRGGILVSITGADGQDQSAVTGSLTETFGKKLDVFKIHFGRNAATSISRAMLVWLRNLVRSKKNDGKIEDRQQSAPRGKESVLRSLFQCSEALLVALETYHKTKLGQAAKKKGALVISECYPHNEGMAHNEGGPALHHLLTAKNPMLRALARVESKLYNYAANFPPDISFLLMTNAEAGQNKNEGASMEQKTHTGKIMQQEPGNKCKIIIVDATKSKKDMLSIINKEIWNIL